MPTFKHEHTRYDDLVVMIANARAEDLFEGLLDAQTTQDIKDILQHNGIELKAKNVKVATDLFYLGKLRATPPRRRR